MASPAREVIRDEATEILDGGLRALLEARGEVIVHGSYALDLMVWRDLDIYLAVTTLHVGTFFDLGKQIAELLAPQKMHFRDERSGKNRDLPVGLYWGVYFRDWKMDLWAMDAAEADRLTEYERSVARRLTPELRDAIVHIKTAVYRHNEYKKAFDAKDIYDAVLDHGVSDVEAFANYLRSERSVNLD